VTGPDVSVIVISWNTRELLEKCLGSVYERTAGIGFEIIVVDNASTDGSADMVREKYPQAMLLVNAENRGFVTANNQAFEIAHGRYLLLLNSDTLILGNAITQTVRFADSHPRGAAFGCRVLYPDGSLQRTCFRYPSPLNMLLQCTYLYKLFPKNRFFGREYMTWWDYADTRQVQTVCGCFSLVRKEAMEKVGQMDPVYFFYGDDPDWCFRFVKAGREIWFFHEAEIIHYGGQSAKNMRRDFRLQLAGSQLIFCRLHRSGLSFLAARACQAAFFFFRIPFWLAKSAIDSDGKKEHLNTAGTCAIGTVYSLFCWKKLVMNRTVLERKLAAIAVKHKEE